MWFRTIAFVALLAFGLAACASLPPNPLAPDVASELRIDDVRVEFAPGSRVSWPDYLFEIGMRQDAAEADKVVRDKIAERLTVAVRSKFNRHAAGGRAARLVVTVDMADMPSALFRIILGGGPALSAAARILDARTHAPIVVYPKSMTTRPAGGGIGGTLLDRAVTGQTGLADRVADAWAANFSQWLYGPRAN
jgi:hypothetical protein